MPDVAISTKTRSLRTSAHAGVAISFLRWGFLENTVIANQRTRWCGNLLLKMGIPYAGSE